MRCRRLFIGILVLGLVGGMSAIWMHRRSTSASAPTVVVERGTLHVSVHTSGTVDWAVKMPVYPPIAGRLDRLFVEEGQIVEVGERVALLSSPQRALLSDQARTSPSSIDVDWESVYRPVVVLAARAGQVLDLAVTAGQNVTPQTPLFGIADQPVARGRIDERDLQFITEGKRATLSFYAVPGLVVTATVARLTSNILPKNSRPLHEVFVEIDPLPAHVRPGMGVSLVLDGPVRHEVLLVPDTAITQWHNDTGVIRMQSPEEPYFQPVTTGLSDGTTTEIRTGLEVGDRIWMDANWTPTEPSRRQATSVPLVPYSRRTTP